MLSENPPGSGEYIVDAPLDTSGWFTAGDEERLVAAWADAPIENAETLGYLLSTARDQVIEYAPAPSAEEDWDEAPPDRFVYAQLQQAINLWNAGRVTETGDLGDGGFSFTPRPLDKTIRQIIRPVDGKPHVL